MTNLERQVWCDEDLLRNHAALSRRESGDISSAPNLKLAFHLS